MGILPIFIYVTVAVLFGIVVMVLTAFLGPKKPTNRFFLSASNFTSPDQTTGID